MATATARRVSFSPLSTSFKVPPILVPEPPTMPVQDTFSPNLRLAEKQRPKKDKYFYITGGDIVIWVETSLFRVDFATLAKNSKTIRDYVQPARPGQLAATSFTDRRPLVIREVTAAEFVLTLSLIFDVPGAPHPSTPDDYLAVLKVATGLQMDKVRKEAAEELRQLYMDPIQRIVAWDTYNLDEEDLLSSYVELCERREPLTLHESTRLGIRRFTDVAACRDLYKDQVGGAERRQSSSEGQSNGIAEGIVKSLVLGHSTVTGKLYV